MDGDLGISRFFNRNRFTPILALILLALVVIAGSTQAGSQIADQGSSSTEAFLPLVIDLPFASLSSALHVLPPVGNGSIHEHTADVSLADILKVEIWQLDVPDGKAELLGRRWDYMDAWAYEDGSWSQLGPGPGWSDDAGWYYSSRYDTIQTADIDGDGLSELLGRSEVGIETWEFEDGHWTRLSDGPAWGDPDWIAHEYYSTIQTADIDGDDKAELLARSPSTIEVWEFEDGNWTQLPNGPTWSGAGGWGAPQYYSTIQTANIDDDSEAELLGRGGAGIEVSQFENGDWTPIVNGPPWSDFANWNYEDHWQTIKAADIDGDGRAELLGRSEVAIEAWDFKDGQWTRLADGPAWSNPLWTAPEYYRTIQTADVDGDGRAELLGRSEVGVEAWRFEDDNSWSQLSGGPPWSDDANWNWDDHYETIQTADIDGDGRAELLGRSEVGIETWEFEKSQWTRLSDGPSWSNNAGWTWINRYDTIQTADIDGDGRAELLGRRWDYMDAWEFEDGNWYQLSPGPDWSDNAGWTWSSRYETIQTADITGSALKELFDSEIRLADHHYQVDWPIGAEDVGETFEVRVAAGVEVGYVRYSATTTGTVTIKFSIDRHPVVRAGALRMRGQTAGQAAQAVAGEFHLDMVGTVLALHQAGYSADQIGALLRDYYHQNAQEAAVTMRAVGVSALETGHVLKELFGQGIGGVAVTLYAAGYPIEEVMAALHELFEADANMLGLVARFTLELEPTIAAQGLRHLGYSLRQIHEILINVYEVETMDEARLILLDAGFTDEELVQELFAKELAARFAPVLRFDQDAGSFPMDAQKWFEVQLCGATGGPPFYDNEFQYWECRSKVDSWGNPGLGYLWYGNPEYSTLAEYNYQMPTYYKIQTCGAKGQVRIDYYWFYGWQPKCDSVSGSHDSDWEHIMVTASEDWNDIAAVTYYQHKGKYTRIHGEGSPNFESWQTTHPVVYVAKNAHGSYHDSGGSGTCLYYEGWRNPGDSPAWHTWETPLIDLDGSEQSWMYYDRTAGWNWGFHDGPEGHPTVRVPDLCQVEACYGYGGQEGCLYGKSNCLAGDCNVGNWCSKDDCDSGGTYVKHYQLPVDDIGLIKDWPWSSSGEEAILSCQ